MYYVDFFEAYIYSWWILYHFNVKTLFLGYYLHQTTKVI